MLLNYYKIGCASLTVRHYLVRARLARRHWRMKLPNNEKVEPNILILKIRQIGVCLMIRLTTFPAISIP